MCEKGGCRSDGICDAFHKIERARAIYSIYRIQRTFSASDVEAVGTTFHVLSAKAVYPRIETPRPLPRRRVDVLRVILQSAGMSSKHL